MQSQGKQPLIAATIITVLIVSLTMIRSRETSLKTEPNRGASAMEAHAANAVATTDSGGGNTTRHLSLRSHLVGPVAEPSPSEREALIADQITKLDQRLRSEPIDVAWARKQEAVIENAVIGSATDGFDVSMPNHLDKQCHSSLCRIRMSYAAEEDALLMQSKLTLGLSGSISKARTFYLPREDGGIDLIMFTGSVDRT